MTDYEPGTVAVATVRGVSGVRVVRVQSTAHTAPWVTPQPGPWRGVWHNDADVTDVRPLVVLDLSRIGDDGSSTVTSLVKNLRRPPAHASFAWLAGQIEAQAKPPRIPEPGLWGVVKAEVEDGPRAIGGGTYPFAWVRHAAWGTHQWNSPSLGRTVRWVDLIDPVLIREGVA